jgi:hypothetical protein
MKTKSALIIAALPVLVAAFLGLTGCASMETANTKSLLIQAGFHVRTPDSPKRKEIYASLTSHQMQRATVNGKVFYVYKDEENGVAYVGREAEYARYRDLAVAQKMQQQYYMAMEMERAAAYRWYGWGPSGIWY